MTHDEQCEATFSARDAAWATFGEVDPYVLAPMVNPSFMGGPTWPNLRQAYKIVRGPLGTLLASDGLSDPFDDSWTDPPQQNGFALEVYAIADRVSGDDLRHHWLFPIVSGFAQLVAQNGHVHRLLDELGTISTELWDVPIPDEHRAKFVNEHGRVAVLVGLDAPPAPAWVTGPVGPIRLANLKLLTLAELAYVLEHQEQGRAEIARRFLARPAPLVSSLHRDSVV